MVLKVRISLLLLVAFFTGCATRVYLPDEPLSAGVGKVTIIREYAEPTAFACIALLDGEKAATISNRSFATFSASAGKHTLKIDWPKTTSKTEFAANVEIRGFAPQY